MTLGWCCRDCDALDIRDPAHAPHMHPTSDHLVYREMLQVTLQLAHENWQHIAALEEQLQELREELRRYVAAKME